MTVPPHHGGPAGPAGVHKATLSPPHSLPSSQEGSSQESQKYKTVSYHSRPSSQKYKMSRSELLSGSLLGRQEGHLLALCELNHSCCIQRNVFTENKLVSHY